MLDKSIKEAIVKEYRDELKDYSKEKVEYMVDLYEMVLDIPVQHESVAGVQTMLPHVVKRLFESFAEVTNEDDLGVMADQFFNMEPFLKKVFLLVDADQYEVLYRTDEAKLSCANLLIQLNMVKSLSREDGSYDFKKNPEKFKDDKNQLDHILCAYKLKNTKSHEMRNWTKVQMFSNMQNVMITALYVCWKHQTKIKEAYKQYEHSDLVREWNVAGMMKRIVDNYDAKDGFKFIPIKWHKISGKESEDAVGKNISIDTLHQDIGKDRHIMLLGEAGCGKTTSIEYLEYVDAKNWRNDQSRPIPVKISLNQVTHSWFTVEDSICSILNIPRPDCEKLLKTGGVNVYLDGVNEILNSNVKKNAVLKIEEFLKKYPETFVVITDREHVEIKVDTKMPRFYLRQMEDEEIREYITPKIGKDDLLIQKLMDYIAYMSREYGVRFTPIILNFLVEYARCNELLPETSADFFRTYIKELLRREYEEKKDTIANERLYKLLMYLAIQMPEDGMVDFKVLALFQKYLERVGLKDDTKKCLDLAVQLGILEERDDNYHFANEQYQECLFAEALAKGMDEWDD